MTGKEFKDFVKLVAQKHIESVDVSDKTDWAEGYIEAFLIIENLCNECVIENED